MKSHQFLIFLSIVISFYLLINFYVFIRGWQSVSSPFKPVFLIIFLVVSLSYIVGRFLDRVNVGDLSTIFIWIGSFWLAALTYFILILLVIDFFRIINHFAGIFPPFITNNFQQTKHIAFMVVSAIVSIVVIVGYFNFYNPIVRHLVLNVDKNAGGLKELNITLASDIHAGIVVDRKRLGKMVKKINETYPDVILLAGDLVDEEIKPLIKNNLGEIFGRLHAPMGVFAITGNHEHIGGADKTVKYLEEHQISYLRDKAILINNQFYIVGREDKDIGRFTGKSRKNLDELLAGINKSLPIILMDHQPFKLEETARQEIDLSLSGHTHHGQLWPLNFITTAIFEKSYGYLKKENTHFYISSGLGGWGPPVRTSSRAEIVCIKLLFNE